MNVVSVVAAISAAQIRAGDSPLVPDPDDARRLLEQELTKPEYLTSRDWVGEFIAWIVSHLSLISEARSSIGVIAAVIVLLVLVGSLTWWILRVRRRANKVSDVEVQDALLDPRIAPEDYLRQALEARDTDLDAAVIAGYRAALALLDRAGILQPSVGRTVGEVSATMSAVFPPLADGIARATFAFNIAAYGTAPAPRCDDSDVVSAIDLYQAVDAAVNLRTRERREVVKP